MRIYSAESIESVVWRRARASGVDLDTYCRAALLLPYAKRIGNLEDTVVHLDGAALQLAVSETELRRRHLPAPLRHRTRPVGARMHIGRVWVCPECLSGNDAHARFLWNTPLSAICVEHRRYLVGQCDGCGEALRYNVFNAGARFGHWMDLWPGCLACGTPAGFGRRVPPRLLEMAADWEMALAAGISDDEIRIVGRIADGVDRFPGLRKHLAVLCGDDSADVRAVGILCVWWAFRAGLFVSGENAAAFRAVIFRTNVDEQAVVRAIGFVAGRHA